MMFNSRRRPSNVPVVTASMLLSYSRVGTTSPPVSSPSAGIMSRAKAIAAGALRMDAVSR